MIRRIGMDTIIKQLSEIEAAAASVMNEANARKKAFAEEIMVKTTAFDQELDKKTDEQLRILRTNMETALAGKLEKQKQYVDCLLQRMEKNYDDHHSEYAARLFRSLIEG